MKKTQLTSLSSAADSYISLYYRLPISFLYASLIATIGEAVTGKAHPLSLIPRIPSLSFSTGSLCHCQAPPSLTHLSLNKIPLTFHVATEQKHKRATQQEAPGGVGLKSLGVQDGAHRCLE